MTWVKHRLIPENHNFFWKIDIFIYKENNMNRSYSKIRHIQESNQRLENRLLNEQGQKFPMDGKPHSVGPGMNPPSPTTTNDLTSKLKKVPIAYNTGYKQICTICRQNESMVKPSSNAKKVANDFSTAISGGANPFDNFGGYEDKGTDTDANYSKGQTPGASPAHNTGKALSGLRNAEELCDMIINYETYSGSDETFEEALSGELSYKIDSSENYRIMFADPVSKILNK